LAYTVKGGQASVVTEPPAGALRSTDVIGGAVPTEPVWSGGAQVLFQPSRAGGALSLPLEVKDEGDFGLGASLTRGPDYGLVAVALDGRTLTDAPFDCHDDAELIGSRVGLGTHHLRAGRHWLTLTAVAAKGRAAGLIGVDYLLLKATRKGQEAELLLPLDDNARHGVVKERFGSEPRWSGGAYIRVPVAKAGDRASFRLFVPRGGRYKVHLVEAKIPSGGKFTATLAGRPLGEIDCQSTGEALGSGIDGQVRLRAGANTLTLTSSDGGDMALDVIELQPLGGATGAARWLWLLAAVVVGLVLARRRRAKRAKS
jgi:hypothetical protein